MAAAPVFSAFATNDAPQTAFFDSVQSAIERQYRHCTGSRSGLGPAALLEWKSMMDSLSKTPAYRDILRNYHSVYGNAANPLPCEVLAWNDSLKKSQTLREKADEEILLVGDEESDARREMDTLPKSPYDFASFPFGISKNAFFLLYKKLCASPLVDMGGYGYDYGTVWGGRAFLTAFYFNKRGHLYKYEIESPALPANRLNTGVRPDAEYLAQVFEGKFGPASRRYIFGYFDIKSGILSPFKTWNIKGYSVYVGISEYQYRYYAKAVVVKGTVQARGPAKPTKVVP